MCVIAFDGFKWFFLQLVVTNLSKLIIHSVEDYIWVQFFAVSISQYLSHLISPSHRDLFRNFFNNWNLHSCIYFQQFYKCISKHRHCPASFTCIGVVFRLISTLLIIQFKLNAKYHHCLKLAQSISWRQKTCCEANLTTTRQHITLN